MYLISGKDQENDKTQIQEVNSRDTKYDIEN